MDATGILVVDEFLSRKPVVDSDGVVQIKTQGVCSAFLFNAAFSV